VTVRGFVFDVDGTIVDNMPFHVRAFDIFTERHGIPPLTKEKRARLDGQRNREILPILFERALADDEILSLAEEKESLYRELSRGRLSPLPGLRTLLDAADRLGIRVALATSAPEKNVQHTLTELGLLERLGGNVVRADTVPRGKPFPDVFLAAAERLGVPAADCIGFEDAPAGIRAVRAAGMACVAVTTNFRAEELAAHEAHADHVVADFDAYLRGPGAWLTAP
jgi:HAD superfamily hydrolase (TIGR01509 family)